MEQQIFGIRAVIEAITSGKTINKVFVQKGLKSELAAELFMLLKQHDIAQSVVPAEKLNRLTSKNHQGVVASISPVGFVALEYLVESAFEKKPSPVFLILDHLSDVRNFGAIIRSAECAGVSGIIMPNKGSASVTADTVKTSAGAVFNVPICKVDSLVDTVYYLQGSGVKVFGASEKAQHFLYNENLTQALAIVMGAEDVGISKPVQRVVDGFLKIPMLGKIGSLNVGVAAAVVLYEVVRQRINVVSQL